MIDVNKLEFKTFPGGELHIIDSWIQNGTILQDNSVLCRIQNSDDLIKLCLFTNAFKNFVGRMPHRLVLPYIPYARQDRIASPGEALSIKVFANLLNTLNYKYVYVIDPRYYNLSISDYVNDKKINEILFIYNVLTIDEDLGIVSIR